MREGGGTCSHLFPKWTGGGTRRVFSTNRNKQCQSDTIFGFPDLENPKYTFFPNLIAPGKGRGGRRHIEEGSGSIGGGRERAHGARGSNSSIWDHARAQEHSHTPSTRDLSSVLMLPREQNPGQQYSRVISPKMDKSPGEAPRWTLCLTMNLVLPGW